MFLSGISTAFAVYKIRVMLRCLCSASSIFPVVYLIKATTTTRKMEDPEQKLFRMTPCLINGKKTNSNKAEIPDPAGRHRGNDGMDGTAKPLSNKAILECLAARRVSGSLPLSLLTTTGPGLQPSRVTALRNNRPVERFFIMGFLFDKFCFYAKFIKKKTY